MGRWGRSIAHGACVVSALAVATPGVTETPLTFGFYGDVGLIDMPTANMANDGLLTSTFSSFDGTVRATLSFQVTPRLSGSFRYTTIDEFSGVGTDRTYDRSFDVSYQVVTETERRPAIAIGLRDFIGTGSLTSEYVVATKTLTPKLTASIGLGWGRFGSFNGFENPLGVIESGFETRPPRDPDRGGEVEADQWFRGDAAFFGGIEYRFSDLWVGKLEYSSDAYVDETDRDTLERTSPINLGLVYRGFSNVELAAYAMHGNELGVSATFVTNPKKPALGPGRDPAPLPIRPSSQAAQSWTATPAEQQKFTERLKSGLEDEGQTLLAVAYRAHEVRIRISNQRYRTVAQSVGRSARVLARVMPAPIQTFVIEPVVNDLPTSSVVVQRGDLEQLENRVGASERLFDKTDFTAAGLNTGLTKVTNDTPRLTYGLAPYIATGFFDPSSPIRAELGVSAGAQLRIAQGLTFGGSVRKSIVGNLSERDEPPESNGLPIVRSDAAVYNRFGDPSLSNLALQYLFRASPNIYGRVTAGYLERGYGGFSSELLWKPVDRRLALGAEVNYAKKRDYDGGFGFQDYDVVTGHVSAYYPFSNGFYGQVDAGRFLAGDYGATISFDRVFENGWRVGAYATFTDATAEEFGEGSFDKGIRIVAPIDWVLGRPDARSVTASVRSLTRDGGARLKVSNRLYSLIEDSHRAGLEEDWGRFWK